MKVSEDIKPNVDLEDLEAVLGKLDPKSYPDYTKDWPLKELRAAMKEGIESGTSGIASLEDYKRALKK